MQSIQLKVKLGRRNKERLIKSLIKRDSNKVNASIINNLDNNSLANEQQGQKITGQDSLLADIRRFANKKVNSLTKNEANKYRNMQKMICEDIYENDVSYIEDAPKYICMLKSFGDYSVLSREVFAKARVTFETMQLNTLDDYFLFFASANLLNSSAKRMDTGYEFKTRLKYGINAIIQEHASDDKGYNPIKDCVNFYSEKDCNMDCVYITVNGVQFSFHRAIGNYINQYPGAKKQAWAGIRLQRIATDIWEYANRLDNLTEMSLVRDDDYNPISLKHLQTMALLNCKNKNSSYYEKYKDNEDIFEIPTTTYYKEKYLENLFGKLSKDCEIKQIIKNKNFLEAYQDGDISTIHNELKKVYFKKKEYIEEAFVEKALPKEVITQYNDYEDIDPRDRQYYDDDGEIRTLASCFEKGV